MKKFLIILASIVVILGIAVTIALYFIGDKIMDEIIDSQLNNISTDTSGKGAKDLQITPEKLQKIKDSIPKADKVKVASIIMSRLTFDEIDELKSMPSGGFTAEEKKKAKSLIYDNLKNDEIKYLEDLYLKYAKD